MINLLPYSEKKAVQRIRIMRRVLVLLWGIIIIMGALCLLLLPSMTVITSRYNLAQNEITRLEMAGAIVRPEAIEETQQRALQIEKEFVTESGVLTPGEVIALARNTIPTGITLSGFTFTDGEEQKLVITGTVTTREVLQVYVDGLQKNAVVAMVDSPITNYLKQKDNEFSLTVSFK